MQDYQSFRVHFSEQGLKDKLRDLPIGGELAARARRLLKLLRDPRVPVWAKALITGALGYLIFPWDASPDFLPWIGYLDDAAALAAALSAAEESLDG
ncbi:Protein of unknown function [Methylomagnum ishizawai]|uniref:DUF1232 domain-containing protein n=1 Tax=Methylomagnum ishizawai TaxID=1760988 RepID=A0A1Y6D470_9GAMM|nr:DUF1232 domain-containing protein [Methylomagnum ishizawai]SMF97220.1 Protein of unknown function [Methylomagnum ishizawai]